MACTSPRAYGQCPTLSNLMRMIRVSYVVLGGMPFLLGEHDLPVTPGPPGITDPPDSVSVEVPVYLASHFMDTSPYVNWADFWHQFGMPPSDDLHASAYPILHSGHQRSPAGNHAQLHLSVAQQYFESPFSQQAPSFAHVPDPFPANHPDGVVVAPKPQLATATGTIRSLESKANNFKFL
ncbi:hypothetical protein H0H93_004694 [Arthromyces matolae]|nr:hypothetical protein H0H93_004694 [Arthromyces matolae]